MNKLILSIFFLLGTLSNFNLTAQNAETIKKSSSAINWMTLEEAVESQKENPKKIMIKLETSWCYYCKKMTTGAYKNKNVIQYLNANYYAVKQDAEQETPIQFKGKTHEYSKKPEKRRGINSIALELTDDQLIGFPTIIVLDESLNRVSPLANYMKGKELLKFLIENNEN